MNKIPEGYRFSFNSLDIRNENPQTIIKEGLTELETNLFLDLSELIKGGMSFDIEERDSWRVKKEHEKLYAILENYKELFSGEKLKNFKDDIGMIMDYISENMLGFSSEEGINMRQLFNYKIQYIPEEIAINDVTNSFMLRRKSVIK